MKYDRQQEMKQLFLQRQKISCKELCEYFNTSIETIRRDLTKLEKEGIICRNYGGAVLADSTQHSNSISPWQTRSVAHQRQKQLIAREAVKWIPDHATIALDSGTTALEVAKCLSEKKNLKVITNDVRIAKVLCETTDHEVCLVGGVMKRNDLITYGYFSIEFLNSIFSIDISVLTTDGFRISTGLADHNYDMCQLKAAYIKRSEQVFAVVDSSKFLVKAPYKVCDTKDIHLFITDNGISEEDRASIQAIGPRCIAVGEEE